MFAARALHSSTILHERSSSNLSFSSYDAFLRSIFFRSKVGGVFLRMVIEFKSVFVASFTESGIEYALI